MSNPYKTAWLPGPSKTQFYTRTYLPPSSSPPKALLIYIHGFSDHIGRYTHLHTSISARGVVVFTYDQRGFGKTALDLENNGGKKGTYAKTSWREQFEDMEWAVGVARKEYPGLKTFLMGQSMGGGLVLGFPTRTTPPPSPSTISLLSGVIATSPLLLQTTPASKVLRWVGGKASSFAPYMTIPAEVDATELSHDPEIVKEAQTDPLIKYIGSLRGLSDMLGGGEALLAKDYQNWPKSLPILILHGTEDKVTSHVASEKFVEKLVVDDKKLSLYTGAYHELSHEPDGVKEKMIDEVASWILARSGPTSEGTSAAPEAVASKL
ncbi:hypothetical protein JAAARDRAFT_41682 [Jaapia argillacea MUCL 33604]|uniref:Serine aminopeptidase S33 domain-containing protein n=1 Tax=Jaapia argillacea MUCL 33604 TaxID=933084 RepID=A0A067P7L9_9AGAM|nr:hypothetical protein JAAARDRAFT_41682 [Jaapia argillacea MUCL 33604]